MGKWLDIAAALFAFVGAVFWFLSAYGKLPPMVTYWGGAPKSDLFFQAVRFSARMNTCAAIASGISALLLGVRIFVSA